MAFVCYFSILSTNTYRRKKQNVSNVLNLVIFLKLSMYVCVRVSVS